MKRNISKEFLQVEEQLNDFVLNFNEKGVPFGNQKRNSLKLFVLNDKVINIKSFKVPNAVNQLAYKFFRKSKAQRSYEYACKLIAMGVGTPKPIAYYEFTTFFLFKKSFYISEQLEAAYTYRDLIRDFNIINYEDILRAFTRFTYYLHEKEVLFLDHSPGNTLIKVEKDTYEFYLVDLNRMEFKTLDFPTRIKNFARLTPHESMVAIMSDEYAKCINEPYQKVFNLMWKYTTEFQKRHLKKQQLKKKLKFWNK